MSLSNTTSPMNITTLLPRSTTEEYNNAVPVTLLFIFGVAGNMIALIVLCCSAKTHQWRPFHRFVCGLAISDGGGILASYPFAGYQYISHFKYKFSPLLSSYLGFVFMFTLMSSAMIVCCMSFDRFFATFYPFLYNSPRRELRTNIVLSVVWFLAGIISSLHLYGLGSSKCIYPGSWCFLNFIDLDPSSDPKSTQNIIYSYIYATTGMIVVLMTIVLNMAVIFFFVRNRVHGKRSRKRDLHVIVFLVVIVIVLSSFWTPLMINILQHATGAVEGENTTELDLLRMAVTNSVLDPWIYILLRKESLMFVLRVVERLTGRKVKLGQTLSGISTANRRCNT